MAPTPQEQHPGGEELMSPVADGERVVISGMAGLYPRSHSVKELAEVLYNKENVITQSDLRFECKHPEVVQYTGSIPEVDCFDAQFFKVHYRLAMCMDPVGRKVLEQAYHAIYDAGVNPHQLGGKKVGVYVGTSFCETEKTNFYDGNKKHGLGIAGCSRTMLANRISYWLNAKGPSMAIDELCCSSTAALEQAHLAMSRGECEAAIVGGVFLCMHPQSTVHYGRVMKLSKDGTTKSFDENADGCGKSEAINVLFLQKAKDALRIYAEVLHVKTEFNHTCLLEGETGPKFGFYRDPAGISTFLRKFYEDANVPPRAVEYVEAFGCAMPESDKMELQAIEDVFCKNRRDPLMVGSVTSNLGYSEAAMGITAITKVLLGYHRGEIAANLHFKTPRKDIAALHDGRMQVVSDHQRFGRSYAAVNGMSVNGTNSHVLLRGHYVPKKVIGKCSIPYLVNISGRHEQAVTDVIEILKSSPVDREQLALLNNIHRMSISGHLGRGFVVLDTNEEHQTISLKEQADYFDDMGRPLWFVYSGMGSQWAGMGTQLMRIPIFAAAIERCRQALEPKGIDIVNIITSDDESTFNNVLNSFVGISAIQIGLTDVLREIGLKPDGIIGHSLGEQGCAYADGCLTAEETILSAYYRGLVSLETKFIHGSMAAVGMGYEQISPMCPPEIEVACHNGPESCTISGPSDVIKEFIAKLTAKSIFAKEVPCGNIAYHSRYIAEAGPSILKYLKEAIKEPKERSARWLSTSVPQDKWEEPEAKFCSAEYLTNNLLSPVLFEETSRLVPSNAVLVEIAPHGLLQAILKRSMPASCKNVPLTRRHHSDNALFLLEAIGKLFMEGFNSDLSALYPKVEMPVSTGTPFLSHFVKWAHEEKWELPLFRFANKQTSATCDFLISLHDEEHSYLRGNIIRGKTIYPFAGSLTLVWDTLAMILGVPKKQLSVEFKEVQFFSQPILHDRRQLKLSVAIHRGAGYFEVLADSSKVITGFITPLDVKDTDSPVEKKTIVKHYTTKDVYQMFYDRDYLYSGEFKSIECINESMSEASLTWSNNWVTLLDGLLQINVLRQPHHAVTLPANIRKISININEHNKYINTDVKLDNLHATVSDDFGTRCGGILMEHIKFENLSPVDENKMALKILRFVPHFQSELEVSSSLEIYCQIVAENVNKKAITVVGIVDEIKEGTVFNGIMITPCASPSGVKDVIRAWRKDSGKNLYLVEVTDGNDVEEKFADIDLAFNVVDNGTLGGEYYLPVKETTAVSKNVTLQCARFGDYESLNWVEAPELTGPGVTVKVHYAGVNTSDVKKAKGNGFTEQHFEKSYGSDFSGITESGERVMGIVPCGAANSEVRAAPELLWPVPPHWSLEDAATVPLAYLQAFYCLVIKHALVAGSRVLVHGGAGALGQAAISIAQAYDCEVFATVSDARKKNFLRKLFPKLQADHISSSRDGSFCDMVQLLTKGQGVHIVISCVRDDLKHMTMTCVSINGMCYDVSQLTNRDYYNFGMNSLTGQRHYASVDFTSLLNGENIKETKVLHKMLSDGIVRGYVRPLSRVAYEPREVTRAFRLLAESQHRGRVLLQMKQDVEAMPRLKYNADCCHLILCNESTLGPQLADMLAARGVKKIVWRDRGVHAYLFSEELVHQGDVCRLIINALAMGPVEGIYVTSNDSLTKSQERIIADLDSMSRKLCSDLRYFAVLNMGDNSIGKDVCLKRVRDQLPATMLTLPKVDQYTIREASYWRSAMVALEQAMRSANGGIHVACSENKPRSSLLEQIFNFTGITPDVVDRNMTLQQLSVQLHKLQLIRLFLQTQYNLAYDEKQVRLLTINAIQELEKTVIELAPEPIHGLRTFFNYVDSDELLATTDFVLLRTLVNNTTMIDDEFESQVKLCIVPGMEGHHGRFGVLCERLKLPALVLQPGLDHTNETLRDTAGRFTEVLLKKTGLKDSFYLLGYEIGVIVALEMAAMLEAQGLTGTVFCLGHAPHEFATELNSQLSEFNTEEQLQDGVLRHMYTLMAGTDTAQLEKALQNVTTWPEKLNSCVRTLLGRVSHSAQYARTLIESALARIKQGRRYNATEKIRSRVVFIRPKGTQSVEVEKLQQYSLQPVSVHQLETPLPHLLTDLQCTAIINEHLDPAVLEAYSTKNLCQTYYLVSSNVFVNNEG
ncbi:fatty acid synthase-like [Anticarsia gemmatalis]|uniref:fatty acid synthase-like n=1 Tax=Anticarsia gemmatalis TaxID=129554 RepID=UPI003F76931F